MSKIKDFLENIQRNYYNIGKALVFIVAALLVIWQMPRTGKFKYEFQKNKRVALRSFRLPHIQDGIGDSQRKRTCQIVGKAYFRVQPQGGTEGARKGH